MYIILNERVYDNAEKYALMVIQEISGVFGNELFIAVSEGKNVVEKYKSNVPYLDNVIITLNKDKRERSSFKYNASIKKLSIELNRDFFTDLLHYHTVFKATKKDKYGSEATKQLITRTLATSFIHILASQLQEVPAKNIQFRDYLNSLKH